MTPQEFEKGQYVVLNEGPFKDVICVSKILHPDEGSVTIRSTRTGNYLTTSPHRLRVVTKEDDPELFI